VIEKFDNLNLIKTKYSKISSFLTIQEGCDKFCHFCVVPYTRGPEYSRSNNEILSEARQLIDGGAKEITLLGQNVNAYNSKNFLLSDLISELNEMNGLERIRYTTSHPKDMTDDLIDVHKNCKKLMPLVHLPVQSGSSKILKLMNRKHNINDYLNTIKKLKDKNPSIKFSSDFIIGYPGETEEDFKLTLALLDEIDFINSYSFIFSPRPGTPASKLKNIDEKITKKRLISFQKKSEEIIKNYRQELLNKKVEVLFENSINKDGKYFGRDKHANAVMAQSSQDLTGKIFDVKITNFNQNTLFGEISL
jgi:tRNA-2-methylthio-N6-dimethylallyladenosine synthase